MHAARFALSLCALLGCAQPATTHRPQRAPTHAHDAPQADASTELEALDEPSPFVDLAVPGHGDAVLVVPVGAVVRRPVVVVGHGNVDRPEWECHRWRYITRNRVFVLCPRGTERRDIPPSERPRFTHRNDAALADEINAGVAALRARYPRHVAEGPVAYAGFSLGAILAPSAIGKIDVGVSHAVLVEGGYDAWTPSRARSFRTRGGVGVLFGCGQSVNAAAARRAATCFARTGVSVDMVYAPRAGHSYDGGLTAMLRDAFARLVEGDARFGPE